MKKLILIILVVLVTATSITAQEKDFSKLTGPYLGQKPPGMKAAPFIPGLLNNKETDAFCSVFSPDLDEFYFTRWYRENNTASGIYRMRVIDGVWSPPEMLKFNSSDDENDMCLTKEGKTIIFRSYRPLPDGTRPDNHTYLWYATREEFGWGDALPLLCGGVPVRSGYPSISHDNTLYFSHRREGCLGVYRSVLVKGEYQIPEYVTTLFSQDYIHGDLYVAPDESYLIVSGRDPEGKLGSYQDSISGLFVNPSRISRSGSTSMGRRSSR